MSLARWLHAYIEDDGHCGVQLHAARKGERLQKLADVMV